MELEIKYLFVESNNNKLCCSFYFNFNRMLFQSRNTINFFRIQRIQCSVFKPIYVYWIWLAENTSVANYCDIYTDASHQGKYAYIFKIKVKCSYFLINLIESNTANEYRSKIFCKVDERCCKKKVKTNNGFLRMRNSLIHFSSVWYFATFPISLFPSILLTMQSYLEFMICKKLQFDIPGKIVKKKFTLK